VQNPPHPPDFATLRRATSPRIRLRQKAGFGGQERGEVKPERLATQRDTPRRVRDTRGRVPRMLRNAKCCAADPGSIRGNMLIRGPSEA